MADGNSGKAEAEVELCRTETGPVAVLYERKDPVKVED